MSVLFRMPLAHYYRGLRSSGPLPVITVDAATIIKLTLTGNMEPVFLETLKSVDGYDFPISHLYLAAGHSSHIITFCFFFLSYLSAFVLFNSIFFSSSQCDNKMMRYIVSGVVALVLLKSIPDTSKVSYPFSCSLTSLHEGTSAPMPIKMPAL